VEVEEKGRIKEKGLLKGKIHIKRKGEQIVSNFITPTEKKNKTKRSYDLYIL